MQQMGGIYEIPSLAAVFKDNPFTDPNLYAFNYDFTEYISYYQWNFVFGIGRDCNAN
jgi:hypothetical protein